MATTPPPARRPFWLHELGNKGHDLVAIDQRAGFIDDDHAIRVAIERNTDIGAHFVHLLGEGGRVGRPAFLVDVETVRLVVDGNDLGAQFPQCERSHLVSCPVRAIDDDAQTGQGHRAGHRALGEFDVAVMDAIDAFCPAKRILIGQRHVNLTVQHALDGCFDLIRELVAIRTEQLDPVVVVRIVRRRDHDAKIGAQRARKHGNRWRRYGAKQKHVHARGTEAGDQRVFDHIARQPCILAEHDAMAMIAALE